MCEPQLAAQRVIQCVSEAADDTPPHQIPVEHQLARDLGLDSFERVELVIYIEDEFKFSFDDDEFDRLGSPTTTVLDLILAVERHLSAKETMK